MTESLPPSAAIKAGIAELDSMPDLVSYSWRRKVVVSVLKAAMPALRAAILADAEQAHAAGLVELQVRIAHRRALAAQDDRARIEADAYAQALTIMGGQ